MTPKGAMVILVCLSFVCGCRGPAATQKSENIEIEITPADLHQNPFAHKNRVILLDVFDVKQEKVLDESHAVYSLTLPQVDTYQFVVSYDDSPPKPEFGRSTDQLINLISSKCIDSGMISTLKMIAAVSGGQLDAMQTSKQALHTYGASFGALLALRSLTGSSSTIDEVKADCGISTILRASRRWKIEQIGNIEVTTILGGETVVPHIKFYDYYFYPDHASGRATGQGNRTEVATSGGRVDEPDSLTSREIGDMPPPNSGISQTGSEVSSGASIRDIVSNNPWFATTIKELQEMLPREQRIEIDALKGEIVPIERLFTYRHCGSNPCGGYDLLILFSKDFTTVHITSVDRSTKAFRWASTNPSEYPETLVRNLIK